MEGYWDRRAIKTAEKYRAQSEVKPVYQDAIARKKHI